MQLPGHRANLGEAVVSKRRQIQFGGRHGVDDEDFQLVAAEGREQRAKRGGHEITVQGKSYQNAAP